MYLNPVGTPAYDEVFADMARRYKYPETTVHVTSLSGSAVSPAMTNLEYRAYEACIFNETVKAARFCSMNDYDALVVGCFYDPALLAAREVAGDTVVVAPCQASIGAALNLANNFSRRHRAVEMGRPNEASRIRLRRQGEAGFLRGGRFACGGVSPRPPANAERLERAAYRAVAERRPKAIILGCTLEVGFFRELQAYLASRLSAFVPVIDPSIAALKAARMRPLPSGWGGPTAGCGACNRHLSANWPTSGFFDPTSNSVTRWSWRPEDGPGTDRGSRGVVPCTHYPALSTLCPGIDPGA